MSAPTAAFAERLRNVPNRAAERVMQASEDALRRRPAPGEWSAIEVIGHLVDKFEIWRGRVERTAREDNPALDSYDQDDLVRRANYQSAELATVLASLREAAERFASVVAALAPPALERTCGHFEYGTITLHECITLPLRSVDDHLEQIDRALA